MSFNFSDFSKDYISDLTSTLEKLPISTLEEIWSIIEDARNSENTIHLIGNGGSAGTPSHSAGDWSKELKLRTISHTDNASSLTAWANDTDFDNFFVGQLSTFIKSGVIFICYSVLFGFWCWVLVGGWGLYVLIILVVSGRATFVGWGAPARARARAWLGLDA